MDSTHLPPPTVLIVDDYPPNLQVLRDLLEGAGYKVLTAERGEDALPLIRAEPPDIILLDVLMPEMDGFTVCKKIKAEEEFNAIPIILVTALHDSQHVVRGLEAGADDFVSKPFLAPELLARIRSHLRAKRLHDALSEQLAIVQRQHEELQRLETLKEELTEMIVHDMNNPLTSIIGNLEFIAQIPPAVSPVQREALDSARNAAKRLMRMIRNLIDIRSMEDNQLRILRTSVPIQEVLGDILHEVELEHYKPAMTICADVEPAELWVDREVISRVLANLVDNAVKYSPHNAAVHIAGVRGAEEYTLVVEDSAETLPAEFRESIFEQSQQVAARQAQLPRGIALGLTFCKVAVEAHGGSLSVEPASPRGNRFIVRLPMPAR